MASPMKTCVLLLCVVWSEISFSKSSDLHDKSDNLQPKKNVNFYEFSVLNAAGELIALDKFKGKVVLVVNVASECGYTDDHYRSLIRLKNVLGPARKFEILAFPCNQFGNQEPLTNADIQQFVSEVYHVHFPVFAKVDVIGETADEAWKYLTSSFGVSPNWNFWKYLVDEDGVVVNAWGPQTRVEDIFHEIKEAVDRIGFQKPQYRMSHSEL